MKFVVSSATLLSHLQAISRVISSKNALQILDCFLLELDGNRLKLTAADSETRLETEVEVSDAEQDGKMAIDAKNLLEPLRELPDQPLSVDINPDTLDVIIKYHNGQYNFKAVAGDEYPMPKQLADDKVMSFSLDAELLLNAINSTIFATADDEMRPVMNGIYFDLTPEDSTFVASDGHKLLRYRVPSAEGVERSSFILSKKPALLLRNLLAKESGEVKVSFDSNNAHITLSNYTMVCRFVEGRYPNYNSVIPANNPNVAVVDRVALLAAIKRVAVFASSGTGLVKMQLSDQTIVVSVQDFDFLASAVEEVPCQYTGTPLNIGFKASFLIDILSNIPSPDVRFELSDPSRAGIILPVDDEQEADILALLMPMMLND